MVINCDKTESSESLITNMGGPTETPKEAPPKKPLIDWFSSIAEKAKNLAEGISKDMRDFDASFNTLLYGQVEFDRAFIEQNHSKSVEWIRFTSTRGIRPVPDAIKQSLLANNTKLSALHESCVNKSIDEESFWGKWQFYCFVRDQQDKRAIEALPRDRTAETDNLIKEKEALQLEEWD
jgi:hypothetical protein